MFRTLIYTSSGAYDYSVELPHWSYCSWFDMCWSFGVVGLEWYPCCRLNISIIRSLRLFCWITTFVVLFIVRCVLEFRCGWVGVVSVLQAEAQHNTDTTPTQPHRNSNTHRTKNNTTNVVIQQNSRKLLMMDMLMSETRWAHKKWNKNSKWYRVGLSFSTITMIHGPINIRFIIIYLISMYIILILYTPHYRDTKIITAHLGLAECYGCVKQHSSDKLNINLE